MKNTTLCLASMLGGMVLGSALALAFTPKTGEEMRSFVRDFLSDEFAKWHHACKEGACECEQK